MNASGCNDDSPDKKEFYKDIFIAKFCLYTCGIPLKFCSILLFV
jgi:hypothetical protein